MGIRTVHKFFQDPAKMKLRQNALTLRRAQSQVTTIIIVHTLSPYSQSTG